LSSLKRPSGCKFKDIQTEHDLVSNFTATSHGSQVQYGATDDTKEAARQAAFPVFYYEKTNIFPLELQLQYTNYKNGLQQIAQKIGDVEQEAEEHKSVSSFLCNARLFVIIPLMGKVSGARRPLCPIYMKPHRFMHLLMIPVRTGLCLRPLNRFPKTENAFE
jgi:hypothetical protein